MLFADDFIGVSNSRESLQKLPHGDLRMRRSHTYYILHCDYSFCLVSHYCSYMLLDIFSLRPIVYCHEN